MSSAPCPRHGRRLAAGLLIGVLAAAAACATSGRTGRSSPAGGTAQGRPAANHSTASASGAGGAPGAGSVAATIGGEVISRNAPAYASSQVYPATNADDADYSHAWRSSGYPAWLAYDLSRVPPDHRRRVYSEWMNIVTYNYDNAVFPALTYNLPGEYLIEGNRAPGGTPPPASGWVTIVHVTGNTYHSGAQLFDMTGYNWLRLRATVGSPSNASENTDLAIKWDIHDASSLQPDSWIFYGDSITAGAMSPFPAHQDQAGRPVDTFPKQINSAKPAYFPAAQDGGVGGLTMALAASQDLLPKWLAAYPGRYVALCLGTNDANNGSFNADLYYQQLTAAVDQIERAGKVAVVPTLVASRTPNVEANGPAAVEKIRALYRAHPEVIRGPDLWTLFQAHPEWISSDHLHPTELGYGEIRNAWVAIALQSVYSPGSPAGVGP